MAFGSCLLAEEAVTTTLAIREHAVAPPGARVRARNCPGVWRRRPAELAARREVGAAPRKRRALPGGSRPRDVQRACL
jgi:hypothetical protein